MLTVMSRNTSYTILPQRERKPLEAQRQPKTSISKLKT